jgi:DNA-binding NtrC family response regulator
MSPEPATILVVDDDRGQRELLLSCVQQLGYRSLAADDGASALRLLGEHKVELVLSDIQMPEMDGLSLLSTMRSGGKNMPVLLITGYADVSQAMKALELGAVNYLEKPIDLDDLRSHLQKALGSSTLAEALTPAHPPLIEGTVAESPKTRRVFEDVALVAPSAARVMILGESGSGKEVVADHLHRWSERSGGPLVKLNCAAIPENLLESELFGHEKGAFTGAHSVRQGCFERADGGTLFLDEIGDMPPKLQVKMLRVLQASCVTRVGGSKAKSIDVRVICATHRDLEQEMAEGRFREDLFYRLNVVEIEMPPLRQRPEDIPPLAMTFAQSCSQKGVRLTPAFEAAIKQYPWPGNVRELQNAMERAVLLARGGLFLKEHLPRRLLRSLSEAAPSVQGEAVSELKNEGSACEEDKLSVSSDSKLKQLEERHIIATLETCGGNRSEAARQLGLSRRTLLYRLKKLQDKGIPIPPPK